MSCRSRANRLRSLSTARLGVLLVGRDQRDVARASSAGSPNTASDGGARRAKAGRPGCSSPSTALAQHDHQDGVEPAPAAAATRSGKQHHRERRRCRPRDGGAGLAEAEHHHDAAARPAPSSVTTRSRIGRSNATSAVRSRRSRSHDEHVDGAEQRRSRRTPSDARDRCPAGPAGDERVEQEEQPDGGEHRPQRRGTLAVPARVRRGPRLAHVVTVVALTPARCPCSSATRRRARRSRTSRPR